MKLSMVIPVYQTEACLKRCLDSVVNQSLKDIEIVIVNDASLDNSQAIIDEYAKKDPRIKSVIHQENQGTLSARNSGVKVATGEYILFLDSDDELVLDACEKICQVLKKRPVDILRFGWEVVDTPSIFHKDEIAGKNDYFLFHYGNLKKDKIFEMFLARLPPTQILCFKRYLWEGLDKITDMTFMVSCEDLYAALYLAFRAKSYTDIKDKLYKYYLGIGISSKDKVIASLQEWNRFLSFKAIKAIRCLLEKNNLFKRYEKQYQGFVHYRMKYEIESWHKVAPAIKPEAWKSLCDGWGGFEVLLRVIEISTTKPEILETVLHNWAERKKQKIKHIGILSDRTNDLLLKDCQLWEGFGYRVTFLSDENFSFAQTNNPGLLLLDGRSVEEYACHAKRLQEDFSNKEIDLLVLSSQGRNFFLWDILFAKDQGIPCLFYFAGEIETSLQRAVLSTVDGVVVRTLANFIFCQSLGANVVLLKDGDQRGKETFECLETGKRWESEFVREDFLEGTQVLLKSLSDQILTIRQQAEVYRARVAEIEASRSWRITKPLRNFKEHGIKGSVRRMFKRV